MSTPSIDLDSSSSEKRLDEFLQELIAEIKNPIHQRLVNSYKGSDPTAAMETELGQILLEVVNNEN